MSELKTAIVTGAGTGVGKSVAHGLLDAGWNVVFAGRRAEVLEESVASASAHSGAALPVSCDVSDEEQVDKLFAAAAAEFGRVDLLFNNAGVAYPSTLIDEIPVAAWRKVVDVNLTGSFLCARAAFRAMRNQKPMGGRIINNGSISAYAPRPGSAPYTATKHAISGLTKTLALDGRPFDIACGQIDIGNAATQMTSQFGKGVLQASGDIASEPVIDPVHVANAVVYMASLPLDANVLFMNVMATKMPFAGRG